MADISIPQVLHNVKEKYLLATGDAETVTYGNIDTKVYDAITSAGGIGATCDVLSSLTFTITERA